MCVFASPVLAVDITGGTNIDPDFKVFSADSHAIEFSRCNFPKVGKYCFLGGLATGTIAKILLYQRMSNGRLVPVNAFSGAAFKVALNFKYSGYYTLVAMAVDKRGQIIAIDGDSFFVEPNSYLPRDMISGDEEEKEQATVPQTLDESIRTPMRYNN
jgi:hypothetical protein